MLPRSRLLKDTRRSSNGSERGFYLKMPVNEKRLNSTEALRDSRYVLIVIAAWDDSEQIFQAFSQPSARQPH